MVSMRDIKYMMVSRWHLAQVGLREVPGIVWGPAATAL